MIKVTIELETPEREEQLGSIRITNTSGPIYGEEDHADYVAEFLFTNGDTLFKLTRVIENFPRNEANAMALVLAALTKLDEEELVRGQTTVSPDMARRQQSTVRAITGGLSRLRHHGPTFRD